MYRKTEKKKKKIVSYLFFVERDPDYEGELGVYSMELVEREGS